jgi:hypothetical protein
MGAIDIIPRGPGIDDDTWQIRRVDLDCGHLVPGQKLADEHRDELTLAVQFPVDASSLGFAKRQQCGKRVQGRRHIVSLLGDQHGAPVGAAAGQDRPEPIQDPAAWRRHHPRADTVLVGQSGVAGTVADLHLVKPNAQPAKNGDLTAHHEQRTPGEDAHRFDVALHARSGSAIERCAAAEGTANRGNIATLRIAMKMAGTGDSRRNVSNMTASQMKSEAVAATPLKISQIHGSPRPTRHSA